MSDKTNIVSIQTPRRSGAIVLFCVVIMSAFMIAFFAVTGPYFFIDHEFNAVIWRTQINKRPGMVNELIEELEGKNYSRAQLINMLGEPGTRNDPEPQMSWSLADCDFSYNHCLCYLDIYLEHDRMVGVGKHCS